MIDLLTRVLAKLYRVFFAPCQGWRFKSMGTGASLFYPFRVDGSQHISIGSKTVFQRGIWLYCAPLDGCEASISIGDGCAFGYNNHITAVGRMTIGRNVLTANNVYISDNLHDYQDISSPIINQAVYLKGEVVIGEGSWIGENACIIGAHVGKNCVIGANAVVTSDIPDYSVAVGVPAKIIKQFDLVLGKWIGKEA